MSTANSNNPETRSLPITSPTARTPAIERRDRGKWFFLGAFIFACFLFWWLPSFLFRVVVHQLDPVEDATIGISVLALVLFVVGYLLPAPVRHDRRLFEPMLDACGNFSYNSTIFLFIPALLISIQLLYSRVGMVYGTEDPIPRPYQALLYTHLFLGFMCIGAADPDKQGWRRLSTTAIMVTLPRLIISLHGGRFFLAQAVVPLLIIAVARGWIRLSVKRMAQFAALALVLIFVPAMTRSNEVTGQNDVVEFFAAGSSLRLFQDNTNLDLSGLCPPLLVSITSKTIPYGLLGVCVMDIGGLKNMPATLDRILTSDDPSTFNGTVSGTGSNYLLDLYLFGGWFAVYAGSALFGFSCRRFVRWTGRRSLFSGIWAECLTRALLAPRGNLGYVFERIPSLMAATVAVVFVVWVHRRVQESCFGRAGQCETQVEIQ